MKNTISEPPGRSLPKLARRTNVIPLTTKSPVIPRPSHEGSISPAYLSVDAMVHTLRPEMPVYCLRPTTISNMARKFLKTFPGDVLYAVKTNPDKKVIRWLSQAGIKRFDVASLAEVRMVAEALPNAKPHLYFMHPVKSREAIATSYHQYGVRDFSFDSHEELAKMLEATDHAQDLNLYVRLAISNKDAAYSLSGKFGVSIAEAGSLLVAARKVSKKLGVCFHVGSQCMDPEAYVRAMDTVANMLAECDVKIDVLDIGGGFPSIYPGMCPPPLAQYMKAIRKGLKIHAASFEGCEVLCEPGRALVAEGGSTVARVELRKGNALYLNEGTYGSLFDAGFPGFVFPVKAMRPEGTLSDKVAEFTFFGPTCDSLDAMKGPFHLPEDIKEGDWIEIGQLGSYGKTMATNFNGFQSDTVVEVADKPLLSTLGVN